VVAGLLYLPFGKFFHIFQRPAQIGVKLYQAAGASDPQAHCSRCGEPFASEMHIGDLNRVLSELDFDYTMDSVGTWQRVCPPCKRKVLAITQLHLRKDLHGAAAD
jgi:hypothetical protein